MHRTISDYKITKRKDGRYYVRVWGMAISLLKNNGRRGIIYLI